MCIAYRIAGNFRGTLEPEIQKKGDWKRPPTPYVKGLTSGEALRVIIALANNYMEDCATVLYPWFLALLSTRSLRAWEILERSKLIPLTSSKSVVFTLFPIFLSLA